MLQPSGSHRRDRSPRDRDLPRGGSSPPIQRPGSARGGTARRGQRLASGSGWVASSLAAAADTWHFAGWLMSGMPGEPERSKPARAARESEAPRGFADVALPPDSDDTGGNLADEVQQQIDRIQAILTHERARELVRDDLEAQRAAGRAWHEMEIAAGLTSDDTDWDSDPGRVHAPVRRRRRTDQTGSKKRRESGDGPTGGRGPAPTLEQGSHGGARAAGEPPPGAGGKMSSSGAATDEPPDNKGRAGGAALAGRAAEGSAGAPDVAQLLSRIRHRRYDEVARFLDEGVSTETADEFGNTLLLLAAQAGSKRMCKLLLRRGASLRAQNRRGQSVLHFCYAFNYRDLGDYLTCAPPRRPPRCSAPPGISFAPPPVRGGR
mgnify:CR=1 FL=1